MKILFVIENYLPHFGGAEIVFKNLAENLVKQGHEVDLVTHRLKNTPKFEIINGVKVHRINCFHNRYCFTFFSVPKALRLARKSDIIQTTTFNGAPASWLVGKLNRKKVVLTVHEVWLDKWKEITDFSKISCFLHNLLEKAIYALRYDHYVAVSNSTKQDLIRSGIPEEKVTTVYNGLDYDLWNSEKYLISSKRIRKELFKDNFVYFFNGRPGTSKGLEYLVKAVALISKEIPNSKFAVMISKDKAYIKRYQYILDLIKKEEIKDQIILLEPKPYQEMPAYVLASDCVVVPSITEGFGFSVVQACALNQPVVASNTTSIPEVVSGKFVLVGVKNPEEIARGIKMVYEGKFSQSRIKRFTTDENIKGYLKIYQSLLNR